MGPNVSVSVRVLLIGASRDQRGAVLNRLARTVHGAETLLTDYFLRNLSRLTICGAAAAAAGCSGSGEGRALAGSALSAVDSAAASLPGCDFAALLLRN